MLHIAEQGFYDEVARHLQRYDLILYEGVQLKSASARLLTYCYKCLAKSPRLGLVTQHTMKLSHLKDRLIYSDVSGDEILCAPDEDPIDEVIITWRDRRLIEVIEKHRHGHRGSPLSIAVAFGAAHMRAVIHHLTRWPEPGYRVVAVSG